MFRNAMLCLGLIATALLLYSCGGGSTVTSVSLTAESAQVQRSGTTTVTATSETAITSNVTGEKVSFSFRTNETGATLDVINDRLDGNGQAKALYRAGNKEGTDVIQASFGSGAIATVSIAVGSGSPFPTAPLQLSQIGTNTIRVTVNDSRGVPVADTPVNFSINEGTITPTNGNTNSNGILEATFTLPAGVNNARVTATARGQSASTSVSVSSTTPRRITLTQLGNRVQAMLLDQAGRPVPNTLINFNINIGTVNPTNGQTNPNGIIETTFTLPASVNSARVTAIAGSVSATLDVVGVQTTSLTRSLRDPILGNVNAAASIRLEQEGNLARVWIHDANGQPVEGALILVSVTHGNAEQDTIVTNANGIAEVLFTIATDGTPAFLTAEGAGVSATLPLQ